MQRLICTLALLLIYAWMTPVAFANQSTDKQLTKQKIVQLKTQRKKLARIKKKLESQLGSYGNELQKLDTSLIIARKASRKAYDDVLAADQKLVALKRQSKALHERIDALKQAVLNQAAAAWQRSARSSPWMGILTGVPVSDIPHRRFLLNAVMHTEEQDRQAYAISVAKLVEVEQALIGQRQQLEKLRLEKKKAESGLTRRIGDKRKVIDRVRHDMRKHKREDEQLAREEKALLRMLDSMSEDLISLDRQQHLGQSVRKRKGHLKWPVPGRIVASYRSRPKAGMSRLQGVQLRPKKHARAIRAMAAGQVRYADWFGGYGLMIIVDYGEGVLGVYAHNDALYKQLGDWIEEGEILADAGSTGWVSRVTLYFEIRDRGKPSNPKRWCRR